MAKKKRTKKKKIDIAFPICSVTNLISFSSELLSNGKRDTTKGENTLRQETNISF